MPDYKSRMNARLQRTIKQGDVRAMQHEAAQNETVELDATQWVPLKKIKIDERVQVRAGGLNKETVSRYATVMAENGTYEPFPPVVLFRDPVDDTLRLSAGFHRVASVWEADRIRVQEDEAPIGGVLAEIRPGGFEEAYWFAITDNLQNGLQLSNADQKEALRRLLGYDLPGGESEYYVTRSDRQLAAIIGVHYRTIGRWRGEFKRKLEMAPGARAPGDRVRIGADGKVYNVGGIQTANEQRTQDQAEKKRTPPPSPRRVAQDDGYDFNQDSGYEEGALDYGERPNSVPELDDAPSASSSPSRRVSMALESLIEIAMEVRLAIETMDAGQDHFTTDELYEIQESVTEALQYLQGYRTRQGQRVAGLLDLLDGLRRFARGSRE